jgi:two-component system, OmpR family, response regulator
MKVLIVEDEIALAKEMTNFLEKANYICNRAHSAREAQQMMEDNQHDFILLDLGLPDNDGLTVLKEAKKISPDASYIIITARGKLEDRIQGLDLGADDYLSKPFSLLELQARMHAITRRKSGIAESVVELGEFEINLNKRIVCCNGTEIDLSKKEFDLLTYLLLHKNRPLSRLQLGEHIWGNFSDDDYDSNYIDVHIKNIRKKLTAHAECDWLQTVRGVGYKIKC